MSYRCSSLPLRRLPEPVHPRSHSAAFKEQRFVLTRYRHKNYDSRYTLVLATSPCIGALMSKLFVMLQDFKDGYYDPDDVANSGS